MANSAMRFTRGQLNVLRSVDSATRTAAALRQVGSKVALVPTMGALHEGHLELVRRARRIPNTVVAVSIFVNPLQFGPGEDLGSYPSSLDEDLQALERAGVELVFVPEAHELYANDASITVQPGPLADQLEGASRPGHFAGVLTVVTKLLNIVRPNHALFGEKDYQQLVLVRKMVRDLNMEPSVVGVPTVRERDGLALSSRNRYLSEREREQAVVLSAALTAGAHAGGYGHDAVYEAAQATLSSTPEVELDYLELRGPELEPAPAEGEARLLIAARLGSTRLIDNVGLTLGEATE